MKKLLALVLAAVMVFSLVACGGNKPAETNAPETNMAAVIAFVGALALAAGAAVCGKKVAAR